MTSGSAFLLLDGSDLLQAAGVTAALERGVQEDGEDLVRQGRGNDAAPHRQKVGVVVLAAEAGREEVVAEGGACPVHLVGGDLLALPAPTQHDATVGLAPDNRPGGRGTEWRVVDGRLGAGAEVKHLVATGLQVLNEEGLERKASVVGGNRDLHESGVY